MTDSYNVVTHHDMTDSLVQYGDGVFETMLGTNDGIHHWNYHWQRLSNSCKRLSISLPSEANLAKKLQADLVKNETEFSVIKMIVSRGKGLRGYRSILTQPSYVQWEITPYGVNKDVYTGVNLRVCQTRLSYQPLLAGMKHNNRLEHILARREKNDALFDEGLLLDYDDKIIEGLVSNVFIIKQGQVYTPDLSGSGVAGTMRAYLFDRLPQIGYEVHQRHLTLHDLAHAEAIFLSNATQGLRGVASIHTIDKRYSLAEVNHIRQQMEHPCCNF